MSFSTSKTRHINVYARWRPLAQVERDHGEISRNAYSTFINGCSFKSVAIRSDPSSVSANREWTSRPAFRAVLGPEDNNAAAYETIVASAIPGILQGATSTFFAYGHSGSGKTHTIVGYEDGGGIDKAEGLALAAARQLFEALQSLIVQENGQNMAVGLSLFELRNKSAFDLLNRHTECHIREGPDGKTHIRGKTEILEGGKVRVQPIVKKPCWDFESFRHELRQALASRAVGSSSVHDQSSRTHAVLELEIINMELVEARQALVERQAELVPVGKRATDINIEEQTKGYIVGADGGWAVNPDYQIDQARIDAVEAEKAACEARIKDAEESIEQILKTKGAPLGAKMVFVDLAGAEYHQEKGSQALAMQQSPQERKEGRRINMDLLALKEVIRAWAQGQPRIPYRSSALTMVLREHFSNIDNGGSAMIVTVSPAREQFAATLNSLKYGSLVGAVGA